MRRTMAVLLAATAALLGGCANPVTDALVEQPLGKISELGVSLQFRMDDDPLLRGYVRKLGAEQRELVRRDNVPYRFSLVELDAPNAFAIPYGGIYVTRGLLSFSDTEDEVAFVLGHEIGHVERRHSSLAFQRDILIRIGLALVTNNNNEDWMQFAYLGNYLMDLHFSRQNEHMADHEGAMFAIRSGHDPWASIVFFHKLDERYGATPRFWSYFETHPINRDRIAFVQEYEAMSLTDPRMPTMIANGYLDRSLFRSAERRYSDALEADPQYAEAHLGLARVHAHRSEIGLARASYEDALRFGADPGLVSAEMQLLPEAPAPPPEGGQVILAAAGQVAEVSDALRKLESDRSAAAAETREVTAQPLDSVDSLVAGHRAAGSQLDAMYGVRGSLPKVLQDVVIEGQRTRGLALAATTGVSGLQTETDATLALLEQNAERLRLRLDANPTPAAVALARTVLLDGRRATQGIRDGAARLRELIPAVTDAVAHDHDVIGQLHSNANPVIARAVDAAEERTREAIRRTQPAARLVWSSRARALQSSIDITMLDRLPYERQVAQRVIERFCLAEPGALQQLLEEGLSYGEAAYVLAMSVSGEIEALELAKDVRDAGERQSVDKLDGRGFGRTLSAAVMMKFIDNTLKDELDYAYGTRLAHLELEGRPMPEVPEDVVRIADPDPRPDGGGGPVRDIARPRRH